MRSQRLQRLRRGRAIALLLAGLLAGGSASVRAHDTWFHVADRQPGSGLLVLEMGSGARYPKSEGVVTGARIADSGCVADTGRTVALTPRAEQATMLELRARLADARAAACWLQLKPVDLALTPELVKVYFDDVRAPQSVRDAWAAQQQAGIGWKEVYRKFVRVELPMPGAETAISLAALRHPRGYPLELIPVGNDPLAANVPAEFQAVADGKPVPDLAVEFVSRRSPLGIWTRSDGAGRIRLALPFAGEWLLRGTLLDIPAAQQEPWRSRFATLTVQVQVR